MQVFIIFLFQLWVWIHMIVGLISFDEIWYNVITNETGWVSLVIIWDWTASAWVISLHSRTASCGTCFFMWNQRLIEQLFLCMFHTFGILWWNPWLFISVLRDYQFWYKAAMQTPFPNLDRTNNCIWISMWRETH